MRFYYVVSVAVPPDAADAVGEILWQAGAQGLETPAETATATTLRAAFPVAPHAAELWAALTRTLAAFGYPAESLHSFLIDQQPYEDWLAKWKADWQVQPVGRRWLVVPPWRRAEAQARPDWAARIRLTIEPGMAFGTGTHETTRACLLLLEDLPTPPQTVLDVGTGTGILVIAAAKLFPQARCEACDTDPEAVAIAAENARLNDVGERIRWLVGSAADYPKSDFDLVLANLTAEVIISLTPDLARTLRPGGKLITAGVLADRREGVITALNSVGLIVVAERTDGEWWTGLAQSPGS
ncbi:MAG: 50S ribosomal protein L11 methyltransferase [Chloracidobacterium sp.]|nr:50S ribosomal protein L11 methyltransferase [Chloracidobacterium sp.]MDW8216127.1 50S ribosomal protein L11 methyltransferase [Acidobacteriota bacterium]